MDRLSLLPAELQIHILEYLPRSYVLNFTHIKPTQMAATTVLYDRDIRKANIEGPRALIWACLHDSPGTAKVSISCGGRRVIDCIGVVSNEWREATPLHAAAAVGNEVMASVLLENGADVDKRACGIIEELRRHYNFNLPRDCAFSSPLFAALVGGHETIAHALLSRGASLKVGCSTRAPTSALHVASLVSATSVIKRILKNPSVDVNAADIKGRTPLHWATSSVRGAQAIRPLLAAKADVTRLDNNGRTPLFNLIGTGNLELAKTFLPIFLRAGADINDPGPQRLTPLRAAIHNVNPDMLRLLIRYGADVKLHDQNSTLATRHLVERAVAKFNPYYRITRFTASHAASVKECMEVLVDAGAAIMNKTLLKCLEFGLEEVGEFLLRTGVPRFDIRTYMDVAATVGSRPQGGSKGMRFIIDHCLPDNLNDHEKLYLFRSFLGQAIVREPHLFLRFAPDLRALDTVQHIQCDLVSVLLNNRNYDHNVSSCLMDFIIGGGLNTTSTPFRKDLEEVKALLQEAEDKKTYCHRPAIIFEKLVKRWSTMF